MPMTSPVVYSYDIAGGVFLGVFLGHNTSIVLDRQGTSMWDGCMKGHRGQSPLFPAPFSLAALGLLWPAHRQRAQTAANGCLQLAEEPVAAQWAPRPGAQPDRSQSVFLLRRAQQ